MQDSINDTQHILTRSGQSKIFTVGEVQEARKGAAVSVGRWLLQEATASRG